MLIHIVGWHVKLKNINKNEKKPIETGGANNASWWLSLWGEKWRLWCNCNFFRGNGYSPDDAISEHDFRELRNQFKEINGF